MARVYIGVGSNINREDNIRAGLHELHAAFSRVIASAIYESSAVGFAGDNFFNLVVELETDLRAAELQDKLHAIESRFGRIRGGPRYAARTLDLDLLLYDDLVCDEEGLQIPRDDITKFAFVLCPLSEIAGDLKHPVSGRSYKELWNAFRSSDQELWPVEIEL